MSNLVFTTDSHLNFLDELGIKTFAGNLLSYNPDIIVIAGDISEADKIDFHLRYLEMHLNKVPVYFVCGNHDYYRGSIKETRELLKSHYGPTSFTRYLPTCKVVSLTSDGGGVALIGHDGWYDGGYPHEGSWFQSELDMNDYHIIEELGSRSCSLGVPANKYMQVRYDRVKALAKEGADYFKKYLPLALKDHDKVFLVTHVPPFPENSLGPDGEMSDSDWMPHFCSKIIGETIIDIMKTHGQNKELIVLCGHSHTKAVSKPLPNVTCLTGEATYGYPSVTDVFSY